MEKILFFALLVVSFSVFLVMASFYFKHRRMRELRHLSLWLSLIGAGYLIISAIYFLWFIGVIEYNASDLAILYSSLIVFKTLVFFRLFHIFAKSRSFSYILIIYLMALAVAYFSFFYFVITILLISELLILLLCFSLIFSLESYKRAGYACAAYSSFSVLWTVSLFIFKGNGVLAGSLISTALFLVFSVFFLLDLDKYGLSARRKKKKAEDSYALTFLRYFVFIMVLSVFILSSTIALHEFGHVLVAKGYDCSYKTTFFEEGKYPHTEIFCDDDSGVRLSTMGGPLLPIAVAVFLFFVGGKLMKELSLLIVGFNLLASFRDLYELGVSTSVGIAVLMAGLVFVVIGIILLAKSKIEDEFFFLAREFHVQEG